LVSPTQHEIVCLKNIKPLEFYELSILASFKHELDESESLRSFQLAYFDRVENNRKILKFCLYPPQPSVVTHFYKN
jgi:hypothetical protein